MDMRSTKQTKTRKAVQDETTALILEPLGIAVLHPDLGLGGAENLVINLSVAVKNSGHRVEMFTCSHDPSRCFQETVDGSLEVSVLGSFLPRNIFGRFSLVCTGLRMLYLVLVLLLRGKRFDVVFNDQLSLINPLCRLLAPKVIFYGHFPDQLLCVERASSLKRGRKLSVIRLYRWPLDWLEGVTTRSADFLLFNSKFTEAMFRSLFDSLPRSQILHPPVDCQKLDRVASNLRPFWVDKASNFRKAELFFRGKGAQEWGRKGRSAEVTREEVEACFIPLLPVSGVEEDLKSSKGDGLDNFVKHLASDRPFFLSLNRYERKKEVGISIEAFKLLMAKWRKGMEASPFLIIAGGFDSRVQENRDHLLELQREARRDVNQGEKHLPPIFFLKSVPDNFRIWLLREAAAVLYTPENEHFGIVPCESMALGSPVIARLSGGPLETVIPGKTGALIEGGAADAPLGFAEAMKKVLEEREEGGTERAKATWEACRRRADEFSLHTFERRLKSVLAEVLTIE